MDTHAVILIQFHRPALLLGPSSHGGPAVGARAAGTQLALQACRVEDVPAAQPGPPHLSRHMSAWDEASAASPSSASCSSETGLGNAVIGTNSSALATAGTTTGSVAAPSSALLAGDGFAGLEATADWLECPVCRTQHRSQWCELAAPSPKWFRRPCLLPAMKDSMRNLSGVRGHVPHPSN